MSGQNPEMALARAEEASALIPGLLKVMAIQGATIRNSESNAAGNAMKDIRDHMNSNQIKLVADKTSLLGIICFATLYVKFIVGEGGVTWSFIALSLISFGGLQILAFRLLGDRKDAHDRKNEHDSPD